MSIMRTEIWRYLLVFVVAFLSYSAISQVTLLKDDFSPGPSKWTLNVLQSIHGRLTVSGTENIWITNNAYSGNVSPFVANTNLQPVGISGAPKSYYLHIMSSALNTALGISNCNFTYAIKNRDQYMTSMITPLNTTGYKDVTLSFWWLNYVQASSAAPTDTSGQVFYSIDGGTTWLRTPKTYSGDSIWKKETIKLPVFDNQSSLLFAFVFVNPDKGISPAFAIDDVEIIGTPSNTPTSNFKADKSLVCKGKCVQFTDLSVGNPTQWSWNFGTGNAADTSNLQNPQFCFPNVGKYSITLTASNSAGSGAPITKTNLIDVVDCNAAPKANFSMNGLTSKIITICSGDSVIFADSSKGQVSNRYWSFPGAFDADTAVMGCRIVNDTVPLVKILYPCAGGQGRDTIYTVTLNVSGVGGATFVTKQVRVKSCIGSVAKIRGHSSQRKSCINKCITLEYDVTVEEEYFITDKPRFKWYFWGLNDTIDSTIIRIDTTSTNPIVLDTSWIYNLYSPYGPISMDTTSKDTIFSTPSVTVCYPDSGSFQVALVTENIYGRDSTMYLNLVSVYGYPTVDALVDKPFLLQGYSNELSTIDREPRYGNELLTCSIWKEEWKAGNIRNIEPKDSSRCHNYFWSYKDDLGEHINDNIDNWKSQTTRARPEGTTWYYVIRENFNGCRGYDSVLISIDSTYNVGIPSIFAPNNKIVDSKNRNWYIFGNRITKIDVKVFNRYGQIVYETSDIKDIVWESDIAPVGAGWDGNYKNQAGKELDPGVYVYVIKLYNETGEVKDLTGNVTLVR